MCRISIDSGSICEYAQYVGVVIIFLVSLLCNLLVRWDVDGMRWFPPWGLCERLDGFDLVRCILWKGQSDVFKGSDIHFAFQGLGTVDCQHDQMCLGRCLHPDKCLEDLASDPEVWGL
jgi:hypothetical protein